MSKEKVSVLQYIPDVLQDQLYIEVLEALEQKKKKNDLSPELKEYLQRKEDDSPLTTKEIDDILNRM